MKKGWVKQIDRTVAEPFIKQWHYSRRVPTGRNVFFGWYTDEGLYAVADYGIGVNCYQAEYLARQTGQDVGSSNLLELKRLARVEPPQDDMPLTRFLKICHTILKRDGVRFILAFSDPDHGHNGGLYKAANFTYLGKTNAERHVVDGGGQQDHRRRVLRYAERHTVSPASARRRLGLRIQKTSPKDRWFLALTSLRR
jgi:hypothetical protein